MPFHQETLSHLQIKMKSIIIVLASIFIHQSEALPIPRVTWAVENQVHYIPVRPGYDPLNAQKVKLPTKEGAQNAIKAYKVIESRRRVSLPAAPSALRTQTRYSRPLEPPLDLPDPPIAPIAPEAHIPNAHVDSEAPIAPEEVDTSLFPVIDPSAWSLQIDNIE
jgi:hypothetical protein